MPVSCNDSVDLVQDPVKPSGASIALSVPVGEQFGNGPRSQARHLEEGAQYASCFQRANEAESFTGQCPQPVLLILCHMRHRNVIDVATVFVLPAESIQYVGDNSLRSNLVASVIGAFWYFATLTEIPITQALMKLGMHKGPVLALLLAGPALSLPNILVICKVMGNAKTIVFIVLVVVMSTVVGMLFGAIWG